MVETPKSRVFNRPVILPHQPLVGISVACAKDAAYRECIMRLSRRHSSLLAIILGLLACRPPRAAQPLEIANPGAEFEVLLNGCSSTGATGRRFGPSVRTALLWSSERVHTATYFPCSATIDAVRGTERHSIYRVSRTRDGVYKEELLHTKP